MSWDDGKHAKVKKVKLTFDDVIKSIEVEYHGTNLKSQPRGTTGSKSVEFTFSSDEYITEVTGYYKTTFTEDVITALTFKTNKNTYGPYGNKTRNYFSVTAPNNNQIAGFFGTSGNALESIDVHFAPIPPAGSITDESAVTPGGSGSNTGGSTVTPGGSGSNTGGTNTGGDGTKPGDTGNAGSNTGGSTVTPGGSGSNTGGSTVTPGGSGSNTGGSTVTPGGSGSNTGGTKPSGTGNTGSNTGGDGNGTGKPGGAGSNTNSNPQKLEAQGGKGGKQWDDGSDHDGVTKIHIAPGSSGIEQIKFDYLKNGESKEGSVHGVRGRSLISTFEIDHPNEYLVLVKLWFDSSSNIIQGIQFKTNTKTSDYFGYEFSGDGTEVTLEVKDKKIIGFHGFADSHLNSLGAYFVPIASTPLKPAAIAKKLKGIGGEEGELWDDGGFDGVRKVYIGQYHDGVSFVKFEYDKGSQVVVGDDHGKKSALGVESFEVDYPSEYITAIGVHYDKVYGDKGGITLVTSLIFKINKRTSEPFGMQGGEYVELKEEGHKIVGFHGKVADYVHQIGVYVAPITN